MAPGVVTYSRVAPKRARVATLPGEWRNGSYSFVRMDQDFHYYGTYYAARIGGFDERAATLIGKASNFIDFLHEGKYGGYWRLVRDTAPVQSNGAYRLIAQLNSPRYTFQAGLLSSGMAPEDGLWCSYHFTPGNYPDPEGSHSTLDLHGRDVAGELPGHTIRVVDRTIDANHRKLLNRPQSALSRALLHDAIQCATDAERLEQILFRALGGWELLRTPNRDGCIDRFNLILLGVRAHVIADTWAHQDFCGLSHKMNTYWDVAGGMGRQAIEYQDVGDEWHRVVLSSTSHENLQAVPNGTSYLGHGWMGHFPDYSFTKFRYKPCWRPSSEEPLVRNNPEQYTHAFLELCSLFAQARSSTLRPQGIRDKLEAAKRAFSSPCVIANPQVCPRKHSAEKWITEMHKVGVNRPIFIDAKLEPDEHAVLDGMIQQSTSSTRYGDYVVNATSDLYLFQIAVDYHFHFVRHWLAERNILTFGGSWSKQLGPLPHLITDLF